MELNRIKVGQRALGKPAQVGVMVATLREGGALPAVLLAELEDGTVFIQDGHHRCLAYVLADRTKLAWGEHLLLPVANARAMSGYLCERGVQQRLLGASNSAGVMIAGLQ